MAVINLTLWKEYKSVCNLLDSKMKEIEAIRKLHQQGTRERNHFKYARICIEKYGMQTYKERIIQLDDLKLRKKQLREELKHYNEMCNNRV